MQFAPTPGYNYSAYMYPAKFAAPAGAIPDAVLTLPP